MVKNQNNNWVYMISTLDLHNLIPIACLNQLYCVVSAEPFPHGTGTLRCLQKEMATYRLCPCVLVARPRRCLTLSNPVPWQNWMAAYLDYTLQMKTLFRGWPVMAHETHTRRRSLTLKPKPVPQVHVSNLELPELLCSSCCRQDKVGHRGVQIDR